MWVVAQAIGPLFKRKSSNAVRQPAGYISLSRSARLRAL